MRLSIVLFDGFTALDIVGGYEVLANVPGITAEFIAARTGPVFADTRRLALHDSAMLDAIRFQRDGTVVTGAGVSASINAGLYRPGRIAGPTLSAR